MKPLLVFDLDGTLIDSAPDIISAVNRTLLLHNKSELADEVILSYIGEGLRKLISELFPDEPTNSDRLLEIEKQFLGIYEAEMFKKTTVFEGVEDFLLSYQGPVGIITNKNERPARAVLKHLNLDRFPWVEIFGADTLLERKPSPLPLQTMMAKAGRTPQSTIMIGDGLPDVQSALHAGVPAIAIGFGYTSIELLQKYEPCAILNHYRDLPNLLTQLAAK